MRSLTRNERKVLRIVQAFSQVDDPATLNAIRAAHGKGWEREPMRKLLAGLQDLDLVAARLGVNSTNWSLTGKGNQLLAALPREDEKRKGLLFAANSRQFRLAGVPLSHDAEMRLLDGAHVLGRALHDVKAGEVTTFVVGKGEGDQALKSPKLLKSPLELHEIAITDRPLPGMEFSTKITEATTEPTPDRYRLTHRHDCPAPCPVRGQVVATEVPWSRDDHTLAIAHPSCLTTGVELRWVTAEAVVHRDGQDWLEIVRWAPDFEATEPLPFDEGDVQADTLAFNRNTSYGWVDAERPPTATATPGIWHHPLGGVRKVKLYDLNGRPAVISLMGLSTEEREAFKHLVELQAARYAQRGETPSEDATTEVEVGEASRVSPEDEAALRRAAEEATPRWAARGLADLAWLEAHGVHWLHIDSVSRDQEIGRTLKVLHALRGWNARTANQLADELEMTAIWVRDALGVLASAGAVAVLGVLDGDFLFSLHDNLVTRAVDKPGDENTPPSFADGTESH